MKFILLTPSQQLAAVEDAASVTVPGEAGEFGVLPGHMALVSTLRAGGTIRVTSTSGQTQTFSVTAGVAEVTPQSVTILAESAQAQ